MTENEPDFCRTDGSPDSLMCSVRAVRGEYPGEPVVIGGADEYSPTFAERVYRALLDFWDGLSEGSRRYPRRL